MGVLSVRLLRWTAMLVVVGAGAAVAACPVLAGKVPRPIKTDRDPQTLIVKFTDAGRASANVAAEGDRVVGTLPGGIRVVRVKAGRSVPERLGRYRERSDVEYAEPNYIRRAQLAAPNDLSFGALWGLANTDAVAGWSRWSIRASTRHTRISPEGCSQGRERRACPDPASPTRRRTCRATVPTWPEPSVQQPTTARASPASPTPPRLSPCRSLGPMGPALMPASRAASSGP